MKWLLIFWALPISLLGSWYWLSYYDINFGYLILSRPLHDLVFRIYGNILGIAPEKIPPLVLKAVIVDSLVLFSIVFFRRRKAIFAWWARRNDQQPHPVADHAQSNASLCRDLEMKDNLSSAP